MFITSAGKQTEITSDTEMQLDHGNKITVKCVSEGSAPQADVSFSVGTQRNGGELTPVGAPTATTGTERVTVKTTLIKKIMVESTWNKKSIQCSAQTSGLPASEKKSFSVKVKMSGSK